MHLGFSNSVMPSSPVARLNSSPLRSVAGAKVNNSGLLYIYACEWTGYCITDDDSDNHVGENALLTIWEACKGDVQRSNCSKYKSVPNHTAMRWETLDVCVAGTRMVIFSFGGGMFSTLTFAN